MNGPLKFAARVSEPARMRYAGDIFRTGSGRTRDRLMSSAYFTVSTPVWGGLAVDKDHLAVFVAAIQAVQRRCSSPRLVVDVGTGAGASAELAARTWPQAKVEGLDNSRRMLRWARRHHVAPNLTFRRGTVVRLPYADRSVDVVTSLNAIVVPSELARVCHDSGHVVAAGSWVPLREEDSEWVSCFRAAGFRRVETGTVGDGSWELYERAG